MSALVLRDQVLCLDDASKGSFQLFVRGSDIRILWRLLVLYSFAVPLLFSQVLLHAADVHGVRVQNHVEQRALSGFGLVIVDPLVSRQAFATATTLPSFHNERRHNFSLLDFAGLSICHLDFNKSRTLW